MKKVFFVFSLLIFILAFYGCQTQAASAEEYYSIGMAYFELGKYEEAERWLNRAASAKKTMVASQYNLGRLAFERGRYNEASGYFEEILKKDRNNVLALRAAAYTRIKTGNFDVADAYYGRLLELVPESADDGYNYALVLYAMERYSDAEKTLENYLLALLESQPSRLLYARSQKAQNKEEAIESYASYLSDYDDARARYEYAQALEYHEYYAKSIEEYRAAFSETPASQRDLAADIRFALARTLMIADSESEEGITELKAALSGGYSDLEAVEKLLSNSKISAENKRKITDLINSARSPELKEKSETNPQSNSQ